MDPDKKMHRWLSCFIIMFPINMVHTLEWIIIFDSCSSVGPCWSYPASYCLTHWCGIGIWFTAFSLSLSFSQYVYAPLTHYYGLWLRFPIFFVCHLRWWCSFLVHLFWDHWRSSGTPTNHSPANAFNEATHLFMEDAVLIGARIRGLCDSPGGGAIKTGSMI